MSGVQTFLAKYKDRERSFATLFLVALVLYGFFIFVNLGTKPYLWLDEGFKMQLGRNVAEYGTVGMQFVPGHADVSLHNVSTGWPVPVVLGGFFKILGAHFLVGRIVASLYLLGFVVLCFLLARRWWGGEAALLASLLLMSFAPLFDNGARVLAEVPAFFWLASGLYTWEIFKDKWRTQAYLSGLFIGIAVATKPPFIAILLAPLLLTHLWLLVKKRLQWVRFLWFWIPACTVIIPSLYFALKPLFGTLPWYLSVHSENYYNIYNTACLSCTILQNIQRWITDTTLIHFGVFALCASVAAHLLFLHRRSSWQLATLVLFVFLTLIYFLQSPLTYRYLFPAQLVVLFVFVPSMLFILQHTSLYKYARTLTNSVTLILVLAQIIHLFFFSAVYARTDMLDFEKYTHEHFAENVSIGVINSALAPVVLPNKNLTQFFGFYDYGILEGINPLLDKNNLPEYLVYSNDATLTKEFSDTIETQYSTEKIFGETILARIK